MNKTKTLLFVILFVIIGLLLFRVSDYSQPISVTYQDQAGKYDTDTGINVSNIGPKATPVDLLPVLLGTTTETREKN